MAGIKYEPERRKEPADKHVSINVEVKLRIMYEHKGAQSLSAFVCELGFVVSTLNFCEGCCSHTRKDKHEVGDINIVV